MVEDCLAEGNNALGTGGAFQVHDGGMLYLRRCVLRDNRGGNGGALGIGAGVIDAEACTLASNTADFGGAMAVISGSADLRRCLLLGNQAAYQGGGIIVTSGAARLEACRVDSNLAQIGGGAIHAYDSTLDLRECLLACNEAGPSPGSPGGAVYCQSSSAGLDQCTLAANRGSPGSAIHTDDAYFLVSLERSLVAMGLGGSAVEGPLGGAITASCCDIWGNEGGDWVGPLAGQEAADGNLCADPLFCGEAIPDLPWSIAASSPCAPEQTGACGLIGACPVGCDVSSADDAAIDPDPTGTRAAASLGIRVSADPNPLMAGASSLIRISSVPDACTARIEEITIHDGAGRRVRRLPAPGVVSMAPYVEWDGRDEAGRWVGSGIYFCRVQIEGIVYQCAMTIVR